MGSIRIWYAIKRKTLRLAPLRAALDRKDTDFIVKFIQDNNLTANIAMRDKRAPLIKLL